MLDIDTLRDRDLSVDSFQLSGVNGAAVITGLCPLIFSGAHGAPLMLSNYRSG